MLSSWDDYPVHQVAETIRHAGTSDRNFYDRYYFNLHGSSDELFMIMGLGQYPNLAVSDCVRVGAAGHRAPGRAGLQGARRPHGHRGRSAARRGDRSAARGAGGARRERVGPVVRPPLEGRHPCLRGASALHPQARSSVVRHHALRPDRLLDRRDPHRRRRRHRHAGQVEGHPRPVVGRAPGRRGRTTRRARRRPVGVGHVELRADAVRRLLDRLHGAGARRGSSG